MQFKTVSASFRNLSATTAEDRGRNSTPITCNTKEVYSYAFKYPLQMESVEREKEKWRKEREFVGNVVRHNVILIQSYCRKSLAKNCAERFNFVS